MGRKWSWSIRLQNFLNQKNDEITCFFACWNKFMEIKRWLKNIGVDVVKSRCGHSGHGTLKLALSQEGINKKNWFFAWWCKFRKAKSFCNSYWVGVVGNGCCLLSHGTLKSTVSQEWINELSWFSFLFFHGDTKFKKSKKITLIILGWEWRKMGITF